MVCTGSAKTGTFIHDIRASESGGHIHCKSLLRTFILSDQNITSTSDSA